MDKIFSLKEACEKGVTKMKLVGMPEGQHIEINLIGIIPYPRAKLFVDDSDDYYCLPVDGIDAEAQTFTFSDNIESYDEYFEKIEIPKLMDKIKKVEK